MRLRLQCGMGMQTWWTTCFHKVCINSVQCVQRSCLLCGMGMKMWWTTCFRKVCIIIIIISVQCAKHGWPDWQCGVGMQTWWTACFRKVF